MKRIGLLILFLLTFILVACDGEIDYEPITVNGFEVTVDAELNVDQGDYTLNDEALEELLPDLDVELPDVMFSIVLEAVGGDFYHEDIEDIGDMEIPIPELTTLEVALDESAVFGDFEFTDAGVFTYRVLQIMSNDDAEDTDVENGESEDETQHYWTLDESVFYIIVTITEDVENEVLLVDIESDDLVFNNVFSYNIESQITEAKEELERLEQETWEARVAEAYAEGYILERDEDGNETRTAVVVEDEVLVANDTWNNQNNYTNTYTGGNQATNQPTPPQPQPTTPAYTPTPAPEPPSSSENCEFVRIAAGYIC